jgi:hypothetical protein
MAGRLFKIRMRPGRALIGMTNDGTEAPRADSGEEVIVSEHTAAVLARNHAAEVIEVVEPSEDSSESS